MKIFDVPTLNARRERLASLVTPALNDGDIVLFYAGEPVQKPGGLDQTYPFLPHPEYFWLTGLRRIRGIVAFSKDLGWKDFVLLPTVEERLWEGGEDEVTGTDVSQFEAWFRSTKAKRVFAYGQPNEAAKAALISMGAKLSADESIHTKIQELINRARRPKDAAEIAMIRKCASFAEAGYRKLATFIRAGVSEREIQIEYESEVLRQGAEKFPYDTIVGAGVNAAVLHAIPTAKKVKAGDLVLIDAGADVEDYCVDITRIFYAGQPTERQRAIYDLVLRSQEAAIKECRPGVEWRNVHETAARVLADGLKDLKILNCSADAALETEAISAFLPHGVGHMVGLKVRDVGGIAGRPAGRVSGVRLRVDLALEEDFVMTVEPGLYFVPALLGREETRTRFKNEINWSETEKWLDFGGVRIEDDIWVRKAGPENLTVGVPK